MKIKIKRVAIILMILCFTGFCIFFDLKKIISSSLCLIGGIFLLNGLTEKDYKAETYIIMGIGVLIASIVIILGEEPWVNIYTTLPPK